MANASAFGAAYIQAAASLIADLENLRTLNDRIAQDNTLIPNYVASSPQRTDLQAQDLTNAASAVTQLLFTFDSGNPTQKSLLFKLL